MLESLSDEAKKAIFPQYKDQVYSQISKDIDAIAREAERNTLGQVFGWGRESCPHYEHEENSPGIQKRSCYTCWQELEKLAEEGR